MSRPRKLSDVLYTNVELLKENFEYNPSVKTCLVRKTKVRIDKIISGSLTNKNYYHTGFTYNGSTTRYLNHRLIWILHNGVIPENMVVDHIDGDSTNNKIENLRLGTFSQNTFNRHKATNKRGLPMNIHCNAKNRYYVKVIRNGVSHDTGPFESVDEALVERSRLKTKLFGEFAPVH